MCAWRRSPQATSTTCAARAPTARGARWSRTPANGDPDPRTGAPNTSERTRTTGLALGVVAFAVLMVFIDPGNETASQLAAVAALMAIWWITEAIPLFATAMLPPVSCSALTGVDRYCINQHSLTTAQRGPREAQRTTMSIVALFDKSFSQSLSLDEAVMFDNIFMGNVCPIFYVETLTDSNKDVLDDILCPKEECVVAPRPLRELPEPVAAAAGDALAALRQAAGADARARGRHAVGIPRAAAASAVQRRRHGAVGAGGASRGRENRTDHVIKSGQIYLLPTHVSRTV